MIPQEERILTFANAAYGLRTLENVGIKLGEETGEIFKEINRITEKRTGNYDRLRDEIGDAIVVLAQLAALADTTLQAELDKAEAKNLVRAGQAPAIPGTPAFPAGPPMTTKHHWQCNACDWCAVGITPEEARANMRSGGAPKGCAHHSLTHH